MVNSTTARDSTSLNGNAPAPSCFESGAQENGKLRLRSVWLSDRKCGDGTFAAVEVLDDAFRIDLVVRRRIVDRARQQQAGEIVRLDHLAARVAHAHRQREAVAVDVVAAPVRVRPRGPLVARHRAHVAAVGEHRLRAVGRHPRQHVEADVAQARRRHRGGGAARRRRRPAAGAAAGRLRRWPARRSSRRARSRACCRRPRRRGARGRDRDRASGARARGPPACGRWTSRGRAAGNASAHARTCRVSSS